MALRNELKFYLDPPSSYLLEKRLELLLHQDFHTEKNGSYLVSSLYFDDVDHSAFLDKISGVGDRCKYRIRYYNNSLNFIRLEKKSKFGALCQKESVVITRQIAESLIHLKPDEIREEHPLIREISAKIRSAGLKPAVFVHYRRKAFLHPVGNVRITFDSMLQSAAFRGELLEEETVRIPVLDPDEQILEVKYNDVFPPYLSQVLEDIPKNQSAISKYCKCCEMLVF